MKKDKKLEELYQEERSAIIMALKKHEITFVEARHKIRDLEDKWKPIRRKSRK